jgi:glycosyltransferase involved in cell wall biosynthesis
MKTAAAPARGRRRVAGTPPAPAIAPAAPRLRRPALESMTYRLGLLSDIPLVEREGRYWTIDLWVQDLQAQAAAVRSVTLFCPVQATAPADWALLPLPADVAVVAVPAPARRIAERLAALDVVQVPGNSTWHRSRRARLFARLAHRLGKPVVLGISSDRATTSVVNARGQDVLRRARARLRSWSVKFSQRYLAARCDGTFVVGEGLRRLVESAAPNLFVGTASWIQAGDILPASAARRDPARVRLCAAARLEPMKGTVLALDALAALGGRADTPPAALLIAGRGPEEAPLRARCAELGLEDQVRFAGTFAYPGPFFEMLRGQDVVVLTNLNDEQPRLVFDAISQGCLIVCPDSAPYRALGIPERLLYRRGDALALAQALAHAIASLEDASLRAALDALARVATIEGMHQRRRDWVQATLLQ